MYNQEIKERFLEEYTAKWKSLGGRGAVFEAISCHEEAIQKDFSQMSMDEASEVIKQIRVGNYGSSYTAQSTIRNYVKWCANNAVFADVNPELEKISMVNADTSTIRRELLFKNEEELISELKAIRPFEDGYPEVVIMLLAWIGVKQKDVMSIKCSDVNIEQRQVFLEKYNRVIEFSDNIAEIFTVYEKTKVGSRPAGGDSRAVYRDDSHGLFVRKYFPEGKSGDPFTPTQIKHLVNHLNSTYTAQGNQPRFTGSNVLVSGGLYRVWMLECSGVDVFSIKNKEKVTNAFIAKSKLHEILWLYDEYKRALNL